ncbi:hypothetical protein TYRP_002114 [Tyrophagus putrescentiae]|nr:hypothetical protein TYRP_002114 [Tyrophagus putrescentiae]
MTGTVSEAELADLIRRLSSEEDLSSLMLASSSSSISWSSSAMSSQTMVGWRFGGPIEVEEVEEGAEEAAEVAVVEFEDWQAAVFSCIWANLFVSSIEVLLAVTPLAVISLPQFICSENLVDPRGYHCHSATSSAAAADAKGSSTELESKRFNGCPAVPPPPPPPLLTVRLIGACQWANRLIAKSLAGAVDGRERAFQCQLGSCQPASQPAS